MADDADFVFGATMVPVRDVARSVAFYADALGFSVDFARPDGTFAIVRRGPVGLHLQGTDSEDALRITAENIAIYITVRDVDALFDRLAPALNALPEGRLRKPFDQPYGMREFHVKDPDGCLLFFGADI